MLPPYICSRLFLFFKNSSYLFIYLFIYFCFSRIVSLRRTSPEASSIKPIPHLLLQLKHILISLQRFHLLIRRRRHINGDGMYLQLRIITPTITPTTSLRQKPLLRKPTSPLFLKRFSTKSRRQLIHSQHQKIHQRTWTATAHRRTLRRRPSHHLPYSPSAAAAHDGARRREPRRLIRQKRLPPVHR